MDEKTLAYSKDANMENKLRLASEKKEEVKEIYISFTELYSKKQSFLEEKLAEGYRVFLNPKKGRALEIKLVSYQ